MKMFQRAKCFVYNYKQFIYNIHRLELPKYVVPLRLKCEKRYVVCHAPNWTDALIV